MACPVEIQGTKVLHWKRVRCKRLNLCRESFSTLLRSDCFGSREVGVFGHPIGSNTATFGYLPEYGQLPYSIGAKVRILRSRCTHTQHGAQKESLGGTVIFTSFICA